MGFSPSGQMLHPLLSAVVKPVSLHLVLSLTTRSNYARFYRIFSDMV